MIADDFYVVKVMHYMKKALLYNGINFFEIFFFYLLTNKMK